MKEYWQFSTRIKCALVRDCLMANIYIEHTFIIYTFISLKNGIDQTCLFEVIVE